MPDIRFGQGSDEIIRVSDGLDMVTEAAMKVGGYGSKAAFVREAIAFYGSWLLENKGNFTCDTCGTRLGFYPGQPRWIYRCDCDAGIDESTAALYTQEDEWYEGKDD